ncbi:MAG: hypothetical protein B7Y43_00675 [Sphingomonas sp. 28-62-20]|nr:MAG: hypothetical protein B7Y43_00675 [Sphingomonas sp. 28-62-20]
MLGCGGAMPALAQDASSGSTQSAPKLQVDTADLNRDTLTVGGGIGYVPSYEGSDDYVIVPAAAIRGRVNGFNFSTRGLEASVDLIRGASKWDFQAGPAVSLTVNRTGRIVDPRVRALGKRKVAFQVGGFVGISKTGIITSPYDSLGVRVEYARDVTNVHESYLISPSITYATPLSRRAYVAISGTASIVGDGYARTYFAVDPAGSAASGLPVFANPKGGVKSYGGVVLVNYALTGDLLHGLGLFATGSYNKLQGDFARSPLTSVAGSSNQWYGAVGLGYTF